MSEQDKQDRLGRGLSALIDKIDIERFESDTGQNPPRELPIEFLRPNPHQPRKVFGSDVLEELAVSIRAHGILQPIIVRPVAGERDAYQIVAGERRWRAAQRAAVHSVPVIVRDLTDSETLELSMIENVQRSDLNAIEEARGYHVLMEEFGHTQEQLAKVVGKSRSHVANTLRLLTLPQTVQDLVSDGRLTAGHGRALLRAPEPDRLADRIVKETLSVRQAEALAADEQAEDSHVTRPPPRSTEKDADTLALEQNVSNALGLKVTIGHQGERGGDVRIHYKTLEQLDDVCRRLSRDG